MSNDDIKILATEFFSNYESLNERFYQLSQEPYSNRKANKNTEEPSLVLQVQELRTEYAYLCATEFTALSPELTMATQEAKQAYKDSVEVASVELKMQSDVKATAAYWKAKAEEVDKVKALKAEYLELEKMRLRMEDIRFEKTTIWSQIKQL